MKPAILITGPPGIGKTTVCLRVCELLRERGHRPDGFLTEEIRGARGQRVGFTMASLDGSRSGSLATEHGGSGPRVGKYTVTMREWEPIALPALDSALAGSSEVLVMDEIGKMELFSTGFVDRMRRLLHSKGTPLLATIALNGGGLIAEAKQMPGVTLLTITHENRNSIAQDIVDQLLSGVSPAHTGETPQAPVALGKGLGKGGYSGVGQPRRSRWKPVAKSAG
mmetsp:Transcript_31814/g.69621  ORF Transcript_31814/g.69621 Transcript_31814/m.69621 type:complete len:224 (+) Transcript_31814:19-690(+)